MEFRLKLTDDSYNSNPTGYLEITDIDGHNQIFLKVDNREVCVSKEELIKVMKVISD